MTLPGPGRHPLSAAAIHGCNITRTQVWHHTVVTWDGARVCTRALRRRVMRCRVETTVQQSMQHRATLPGWHRCVAAAHVAAPCAPQSCIVNILKEHGCPETCRYSKGGAHPPAALCFQLVMMAPCDCCLLYTTAHMHKLIHRSLVVTTEAPHTWYSATRRHAIGASTICCWGSCPRRPGASSAAKHK
jgi:hypothetical protein